MKMIYNGTAHEIKFFSPTDCAKTRDGRYFLKNENAVPTMIVPQHQPLSIHRNQYQQCLEETPPYCFLPDAACIQMDYVPQYLDYDVIIVSSLYGEMVHQNPLGIHSDYADRLFTLIPVYATAPEKGMALPPRIGALGVKKVSMLRTPIDYVQLLRNNVPVSRSAIETSIRQCELSGLQYDYTSVNAIMELKYWLQSFQKTQEVRQTKQFNL